MEKNNSCSVIVSNISPSPNGTTKTVLNDFFQFCGNIISLSLTEDPIQPDTLIATITFETELAARTATLLSDALINDRTIKVELASNTPLKNGENFTSQNLPNYKTEGTVLTDLLARGYQYSTELVINKAKQIDDQHGVTQALSAGISVVTAKVTELDTQYSISTTARSLGEQVQATVLEVDQQYSLSATAQTVGSSVGDLLSTAVTSTLNTAEAVGIYVQNSPHVAVGIETVKTMTYAVGSSIGSGLEALGYRWW